MKHLAILTAALALCGLVHVASAQQASQTQPASATTSPAVMLEKGIYTEETAGNLDEAIKVYQQIVTEAQANKKYAAQAQYRLAMCYLKKKENAQAIKALKELQTAFPDQKILVAKAQEQLETAKGTMSDAEVAKIVADVVTEISTLADGDPRIPPLLQSLRDLKQAAALKAIATYFDSEKNTIRRAAIYAVWKGDFSDPAPAVPGLIKLCSHQEDLTRGMAALALAGLKVPSAFGAIADMTANDKSPYARRAAAYALGLLGDVRGIAVLQKALNDPEALVRNNAEAALTMLAKANPTGEPPRVIKCSPAAFANDVDPSLAKITATFDRPMRDKSWSFTGGDKAFCEKTGTLFPEAAGDISYDAARTTCTMPVKLQPGKVYWVGVNSPSFQNFKAADGTSAKRFLILFATKSADGKPTPLPEDLVRRATAINAASQAGEIDNNARFSPESLALIEAASRRTKDFIAFLSQGKLEDAYKCTSEEYRQNHKDLDKFASNVDWSKTQIVITLVAEDAACVVATPVFSKDGKNMGDTGFGLVRFGKGWLIRDIDRLPNEAARNKFIEEFKTAYPKNAGGFIGTLEEANRAKLINWVENFFSENYRDITARKTLEWGNPERTAGGNLSIRYKYLATIWGKDKMLIEQRFTFTPEGKYISAETIEKGPATSQPTSHVGDAGPAGNEALKAKLVNWVENFFSENYRDITARKTLEWGNPERTADGNLSIRYKYLATIWGKDKMIIEQRFTFTPEGKYVSAETIEKGPATSQPTSQGDADGKR